MRDIEILQQNIEQHTSCSIEKQKKLINWFNKQNLLIKIDIFKEQKNQYFRLKQSFDNNDVLSFTSFILAIDVFFQKEQQLKKKNTSSSLSSIKSQTDFSIKKFRKHRRKEKREKLLNIWSTVKKLKNEEYSFRDISLYIKQRHRFEVSHTYISALWKEIENEF
jgi:hypothetical protein